MATDESINKLVGLFVYHRSRSEKTGPGGPVGVDPELYLAHVTQTLSNTMEDVYRIQVGGLMLSFCFAATVPTVKVNSSMTHQ